MEQRYLMNEQRLVLRSLSLVLVLCIFMMPAAANAQNEQPKLLLMHLDAVSYHILMDEMDQGNLPNIQRIFGDEGGIEKAITYYPSKTPFVISSIRDATPSTEGPVVGWQMPPHLIDDRDDFLNIAESFMLMALSKQRVARANLLYGLPWTNLMADVALMNALDFFDEYNVLEFYWYKIDTYGHFYGKGQYIERLHEFDRMIGRFMDRLDDDINVVIYSDHGMVFGEGVEIEKKVKEQFESEIITYSYPTLYLEDGQDAETIARRVVDETEIDFAFFEPEEDLVKGFWENSTLWFEFSDGTIQYRVDGEDPFGYFENGYDGEFMSADEWLLFSADMEYPATPVMVYWYLQNPGAGEIVTSFNSDKFAQSAYSSSGNHGGFTASDIVVPVLVRGPLVEHIAEFEVLWLQELFIEISDFEFKQEPSRDKHYISSRYNVRSENSSATLSVSPYYRYRLGADLDFGAFDTAEIGRVWGKYDLYRSYIARLWFGGGVDFYGPDTTGFLLLKHELKVRKLTAKTFLSTAGNHRFTIGYDLNRTFTVELSNFNSIGFRLNL